MTNGTGILVAAFADDPVFTRLFPDDRPAALTAWFTVVLDVLGGCAQGSVRITDAAVAAWTTGNCSGCLSRLNEALTEIVWSRASGAGSRLTAALHEATAEPAEPVWWLHWLGTRPQERGCGHGGRLLAELCAAARATGHGLVTSTPNPLAVPFYHSYGMHPIKELPVPGYPGLRYWTLLAECSPAPG